jgi:heme exporter protein CcmD
VITAVLTVLLAQADASPPDEMGYVWGSYALVVVVLVGYAVVTIRRGRAVGRRLPPDERRWM